jgi:hypothetical protein
MPLDDRLTRALRREGEAIDPGRGDSRAVIATARRRVRRRRVVTGAAAAVLLLVIGAVAVTALDEEPDSRIVTEIPTTTAGPSTTAPSTTTAPTTTAVPITDVGCSPHVLFTDVPEGWSRTVVQGAGGGTGAPGQHLPGAQGRYIDLVQWDDPRIPLSPLDPVSIDLPALGVSAQRSSIHEGTGVRVPLATACGPGFAMLAYGISNADLERVLLGMRAESDCSGNGVVVDDSPAIADLPPGVVAGRDALVEAARGCDFLGLHSLAVETNPASWWEDGSGASVADRLRGQEAEGKPLLRAFIEALAAEPARFEGAYTFPADCLREVPDPPEMCIDLSADGGALRSFDFRG